MNGFQKKTCAEHQQRTYQIVYLNGPSSVGKSTIARLLQQQLQDPFLVIGIDQLIFMMPEKFNNFTGTGGSNVEVPGFSFQEIVDETGAATGFKIHTGYFGQRMVKALKELVITLARSGFNVIVDDVSFGKKEVQLWNEALREFSVLWVGVHAPLEVIEAREKARGDRKVGSARWQAERVHIGVNYDIMIDTHEKSLDENVAELARLIKGQSFLSNKQA